MYVYINTNHCYSNICTTKNGCFSIGIMMYTMTYLYQLISPYLGRIKIQDILGCGFLDDLLEVSECYKLVKIKIDLF